MLIYLKQSTDEISLALGISRPSVNSGRSRIRKKLGLQKENPWDEFLQKDNPSFRRLPPEGGMLAGKDQGRIKYEPLRIADKAAYKVVR